MNTLIVDSDPTVRDLLVDLLKKQGFKRVTSTETADEAMKLLAASQDSIGCFLIDIEAPVTDGVALCRMVRRTNRFKNTPILVMASPRHETMIHDALSAGASDFLLKPLDAVELRERLHFAKIIKDPVQARQLALMRATHKLEHVETDGTDAVPISVHIPELGAANIDRSVSKQGKARGALRALFASKPKNDL